MGEKAIKEKMRKGSKAVKGIFESKLIAALFGLLWFSIMGVAATLAVGADLWALLFAIVLVIAMILNLIVGALSGKKIVVASVVLALVSFIICVRPWFHGLAMFFYVNPGVWEVLLVPAIVCVAVHLIYRSKIKKVEKRENAEKGGAESWKVRELRSGRNWITVITAIIALVASAIVVGLFQGAYSQCYLAANLEAHEINQLTEMDPSYVRVTPMIAANRYVKDACQYPRYTPAYGDIAIVEGVPCWTYAVVPDGLINVYVLKNKGAMYVNMSTSVKNTSIIEKDLSVGLGMQIQDDIYWRIYSEKYWIDCEDPYIVPYENELYIVVPYKTYEYHFAFPTFYTVPKWGGVILVNSDGELTWLTPEEAREHPALSEQKLFPESLARYHVDSFRFWKAKESYWDAITNVWFYYENELEITDVSGQGNEQPFLIKTTEGLEWFISTEPHGEAHGIYRVYMVDARTGDIQFVKYSGEEIGPVKACDYARKAEPQVDWYDSESESGRFIPVEPIPIVVENKLWWEVRIVPKDGSGIAYVAFVDTITGQVVECGTDEEINTFLKTPPTEEEDKVVLVSTLIDKDEYVIGGNTRWILTLGTADGQVDVLVKAEMFDHTAISTIMDLTEGDNVTVTINPDYEVIDIGLKN